MKHGDAATLAKQQRCSTRLTPCPFVLKTLRFILLIFKKEKAVENIFPSHAEFESSPYDKIERALIDKPIQSIRFFMSKFAFLQNGRLQYYIIYGVTFILAIIAIH
jgi:hypothetical protein